jgi:hypothetical protein
VVEQGLFTGGAEGSENYTITSKEISGDNLISEP